MTTITVIGDDVQPASTSIDEIRSAIVRSGLEPARFRLHGVNWIPREGFATAAERAEKGGDLDHLPPEIDELISRTDILVTHFFPVRAHALNRAPQLKAIATLRHGMENIDLELAEKRGLQVINNPGREAEPVAEFTVALMLDVARLVSWSAQAARRDWGHAFAAAAGARLFSGLTIGLVGFGQVGRRVASKLGGLGCRILAHDPFVSSVVESTSPVQWVTLPELLQTSDIVSLHVRLGPETVGMIGQKELALMGPGSYLINTSRADLVDREALLNAAERREIGGAALDVLWSEPAEPTDRILTLPNVLVTPHIAGTTSDSPRLSANLLAERLTRSLHTF